MKYPRGRPEPGECSAHRIMVIRLVEQKRRNENLAWLKTKIEQKIGLETSFDQSEQGHQNMTTWRTVALKAPKKFSVCLNNTYEVS